MRGQSWAFYKLQATKAYCNISFGMYDKPKAHLGRASFLKIKIDAL
jgi:hypothetical protein